jgi:hypothetical protein
MVKVFVVLYEFGDHDDKETVVEYAGAEKDKALDIRAGETLTNQTLHLQTWVDGILVESLYKQNDSDWLLNYSKKEVLRRQLEKAKSDLMNAEDALNRLDELLE